MQAGANGLANKRTFYYVAFEVAIGGKADTG